MKFKVLVLPIILLLICSCKKELTKEINLSGTWRFQIDSLDQGIKTAWYKNKLTDTVRLPGSMAENGKGNDIAVNSQWTGSIWDSAYFKSEKYAPYRKEGNIKVPFWLQPNKHYIGVAWYQKEIVIPEDWGQKRIVLHLERPHWETQLWLDSEHLGMVNNLGSPHKYVLTDYLKPGKHLITIRVDNRVKEIDPGQNSHSISDHTQTNWNGIVGHLRLESTPLVTYGIIQLYPDVSSNKVIIKGNLINDSGKLQTARMSVMALGPNNTTLPIVEREIEVGTSKDFEFDYPMGSNPELWDEFNPNLYTMVFELQSPAGVQKKEIRFGMRNFRVEGKHFSINDRPVFLRGTLESAIFPKTGYPPTDIGSWKRILKICKDHGLNHMRFHSWCPPKAAFDAADELGIYLQVEASSWANQGSAIGDGRPIDKWLYEEADAILNTYGNHPSFVMMAYGNEPGGDNQNAYLTKFIDHFRSKDTRRVYTGGAGWPYLKNMDYYNNSAPRIQGWGQELESIINKEPPQTQFDFNAINNSIPMPYVSHEIGQWCVYPNFKEIEKYDGVLKAHNFEIFQESLRKNHLGHLSDSLMLASGKLQALCYKADIEAALRTKDFAGFQLLDLHDFPGQGTALVGVLDAFWDEKGYITPQEYRQFCSETVPLARLAKRIFLNNETLKANIEVAHYGATPLNDITPTWELSDKNGVLYAKGEFTKTNIPIGNGFNLGEISVDLNKSDRAQKLVLSVRVGEHKNSWDLWVYPAQNKPIAKADQIMVVQKFEERTINYLKNGGNVLLNITKGDIAPKKGGDIGVGFSSIFWNTSWTNGQKPHTLGILTNPEHPALSEFPTEYHSNWQWWDAMSHSNAIVLDDFTPDLKPIVRIVDDWFENRRTALLFEVKLGKGKLLVSGIDLHSDLAQRPEARQLLYSLKKYMSSDQFNPAITMESDDIKSLFTY